MNRRGFLKSCLGVLGSALLLPHFPKVGLKPKLVSQGQGTRKADFPPSRLAVWPSEGVREGDIWFLNTQDLTLMPRRRMAQYNWWTPRYIDLCKPNRRAMITNIKE